MARKYFLSGPFSGSSSVKSFHRAMFRGFLFLRVGVLSASGLVFSDGLGDGPGDQNKALLGSIKRICVLIQII